MPASSGKLPVGGFASMVPEFDVLDLEASLGFWCGGPGFTVAYDRPERGFADLERPVAVAQAHTKVRQEAGVEPGGPIVISQLAVHCSELSRAPLAHPPHQLGHGMTDENGRRHLDPVAACE